jgi:hypothetical protein
MIGKQLASKHNKKKIGGDKLIFGLGYHQRSILS